MVDAEGPLTSVEHRRQPATGLVWPAGALQRPGQVVLDGERVRVLGAECTVDDQLHGMQDVDGLRVTALRMHDAGEEAVGTQRIAMVEPDDTLLDCDDVAKG